MVINYGNKGRIGNQMFALAFSKILEHELGCEHVNSPLHPLPKEWFTNVPDVVAAGPGPDIEINDSVKDKATAVACCRDRVVAVKGFFERAEFYIPHREMLLKLFEQDLTAVPVLDVVFHVRGGDFLPEGKDVPASYYREAWEMLGRPDRVSLVTDDQDFAVSLLHEIPCTIYSVTLADPLADFKILRNAKNLAISRSTFAWWAAFLSNASTIQPTWKDGDPSLIRNLTNPNWKQIPC